jgi:hypothetical protein
MFNDLKDQLKGAMSDIETVRLSISLQTGPGYLDVEEEVLRSAEPDD